MYQKILSESLVTVLAFQYSKIFNGIKHSKSLLKTPYTRIIIFIRNRDLCESFLSCQTIFKYCTHLSFLGFSIIIRGLAMRTLVIHGGPCTAGGQSKLPCDIYKSDRLVLEEKR